MKLFNHGGEFYKSDPSKTYHGQFPAGAALDDGSAIVNRRTIMKNESQMSSEGRSGVYVFDAGSGMGAKAG